MVNYQEMFQEQFDQMALILVDVCESYWPKYACPVFGGIQCGLALGRPLLLVFLDMKKSLTEVYNNE